MKRLFLLLALASPLFATYKSGIDITFSGTPGTDYAVEDSWSDPTILDRKTVYLKSATSITLAHNSRNVSWSGSGNAMAPVSGGNVGVIMYKIDRDMQWGPSWGDGGSSSMFYNFGGGNTYVPQFNNPTYSAPFTLASLTYDGSVPVVGTTGATGAFTDANYTSYWRGIADSVGDEWHVLTVADYDSFVGDVEGKSSDGKLIWLVVNPKTPCLNVTTTGTAQFYTTPPKAYFSPVIRPQTTYASAGTGTWSITLTDINGNHVWYRINGGSFADGGSSAVTIPSSSFSTGSNTLEYYYTGNAAYTKTRAVVKDPTFPSAAESHGNLIWGNPAGLAAAVARTGRAPYAADVNNTARNAVPENPISSFLTDYGTGKRNVYGQFAINSAFWAAANGFTAIPTGQSLSFAQIAKRMLIDSERNLDPVGFEISHSNRSIPTRELYYRGYYDMNCTMSMAFSYDILIANYKSTQVTGGITPVEDYFIRDALAGCVYDSMMQEAAMSGRDYPDTGMWGTARNIGGLIAALAIPNYSSPYYGTSGFDGNATVYSWCPFQGTGLTWKKVLLDNDATLSGYPNLNHRFGVEETEWPNTSGNYENRVGYLAQHMMGHMFSALGNVTKMWTSKTYPHMQTGFDHMVAGTCTSLLDGYTVMSVPPGGLGLAPALTLASNSRFPSSAPQGRLNGLSNPAGSDEAEGYDIYIGHTYAYVWYDDTYTGSDTTPPTLAVTSPTSSPTYSTSTTPLTTLAGTASDNVSVASVTWSNSAGGSGTATGTTSWSVPSITLQPGANAITVTATDTSSNTATSTLTVTMSAPPVTAKPDLRKTSLIY